MDPLEIAAHLVLGYHPTVLCPTSLGVCHLHTCSFLPPPLSFADEVSQPNYARILRDGKRYYIRYMCSGYTKLVRSWGHVESRNYDIDLLWDKVDVWEGTGVKGHGSVLALQRAPW